MKWTEISDNPENKRYELLSQELKDSGFENEFVQTILPQEFCSESFFDNEDNQDLFKAYLENQKSNFDQIRIGGFFKKKIDLFSHEYPAELMQIKTLDSLVKEGGRWWPRSQLYHGVIYFLAREIKHLDLSSPILIVGINADSKTIISSFIKMGFSQINVTDVDSEECHDLVEDLKRSYFSTEFDMTEAAYVTQLPNIFSVAVNTLAGDLDETSLMGLIYFNFLAKGGFWIETHPRAMSTIANEATSFGFDVKLGIDLIANVDFVWAKSVLDHEIDIARLKENYKTKLF